MRGREQGKEGRKHGKFIPLASLLFPNSRESPFVESGLFFVTWIFLFFLLDLVCSALLPPSLPPLTLSLDGSFLVR